MTASLDGPSDRGHRMAANPSSRQPRASGRARRGRARRRAPPLLAVHRSALAGAATCATPQPHDLPSRATRPRAGLGPLARHHRGERDEATPAEPG